MQTAKEKASNATASAKAGMEKTKATVQEKVISSFSNLLLIKDYEYWATRTIFWLIKLIRTNIWITQVDNMKAHDQTDKAMAERRKEERKDVAETNKLTDPEGRQRRGKGCLSNRWAPRYSRVWIQGHYDPDPGCGREGHQWEHSSQARDRWLFDWKTKWTSKQSHHVLVCVALLCLGLGLEYCVQGCCSLLWNVLL